jgi:ketosteroid isomerase-like protein
MSQENVETLRTGYAAFGRGDFEAAFQLLDRDIEWKAADRSPFAGTYRGHEAVRELLQSLFDSKSFPSGKKPSKRSVCRSRRSRRPLLRAPSA